jgi:hypothetical protein
MWHATCALLLSSLIVSITLHLLVFLNVVGAVADGGHDAQKTCGCNKVEMSQGEVH